MQPLKNVKGNIVHTTILDKYLNVRVNTLPFCIQGKQQFFMVTCLPLDGKSGIEANYVLKSIEHSTNPIEFNTEVELLLKAWNLNKHKLDSVNIAKVIATQMAKESGTGLMYSEVLYEDCGQSLLHYVAQNEVEVSEMVDYAHQVVNALYIAGQCGVYHGDVQPAKIFVKNSIVKIIDFGGTLFISEKRNEHIKKMLLNWSTIYWPPEKYTILESQASNVISSFDVYSWGITFYQLLSKKSVKELEAENIFYKQDSQSYKGFLNKLQELFISYKADKHFVMYFEPLLKIALEFSKDNRATLELLYDHSYYNKGLMVKKGEIKKVEMKTMQKNLLVSNDKKILCHCCMKETRIVLKGTLECGHKTCENCTNYGINNVLIRRIESELKFYCYLCKNKRKIKELHLKCGCSCDIYTMENTNQSKILSLDGDRKRLCMVLCNNNHELTETEVFIIFGSLKLTLGNARLTNEDLMPITNSLEKLQLIEEIDLGHNQINSIGLEVLASVLGSKKAFTTLNLDSNPIGSDGGKAILSLLESSSSITSINMGTQFVTIIDTCKLGYKGALEIARGIKKSETIASLSLEWNQIEANGAAYLASAIKKSSSLKHIKLGK